MIVMSDPKVSVCMTVFNGEKYIREAMDSILHQTFTDFEFIIVLDPSQDKTFEIIDSYHDNRIKLIHNKHRIGFIASKNLCLHEAKGEFIAILDADDVSVSNRLFKQYSFLKANPSFGLLGARAEYINEKSQYIGKAWRYGLRPESINTSMIFGNYFVHSSIMLRKSAIPLDQYISDSNEDYDLWSRMILSGMKVWSLPDILVKCRVHGFNRTLQYGNDRSRNDCYAVYRKLLSVIAIFPNDNDLYLHYYFSINKMIPDHNTIIDLKDWLIRLIKSNEQSPYFNHHSMEQTIVEKWLIACLKSKKLSILKKLILYFSFELSKFDLLKYMIRYIPYYLRYRRNRNIGDVAQ